MAATTDCRMHWPRVRLASRLAEHLLWPRESGMKPEYRTAILKELRNGTDDAALVKTTIFSPTGFSFKVVQLKDTLSDDEVYEARRRTCDIGLLQQRGFSKPDEDGVRTLSSAVRPRRSIATSTIAASNATPTNAAAFATVCSLRSSSGSGEEDKRGMDRGASHRYPRQQAGWYTPSLAAGPDPLPCSGCGDRYIGVAVNSPATKLMFWRNQEYGTPNLASKPQGSTEHEFSDQSPRRWVASGPSSPTTISCLGCQDCFHPTHSAVLQHHLDTVGMRWAARQDAGDDAFCHCATALVLFFDDLHLQARSDFTALR